MKSMTRPTPKPIAKPPHKNTNSCKNGRCLLSRRTTKPSRIGSKITELANTSTVVHMLGNRTSPAGSGLEFVAVEPYRDADLWNTVSRSHLQGRSGRTWLEKSRREGEHAGSAVPQSP
jgi:hypothetical protein